MLGHVLQKKTENKKQKVHFYTLCVTLLSLYSGICLTSTLYQSPIAKYLYLLTFQMGLWVRSCLLIRG